MGPSECHRGTELECLDRRRVVPKNLRLPDRRSGMPIGDLPMDSWGRMPEFRTGLGVLQFGHLWTNCLQKFDARSNEIGGTRCFRTARSYPCPADMQESALVCAISFAMFMPL